MKASSPAYYEIPMDSSQNVCYTDVHVFELIKTSDFHKYLYILHNVSFT